MVASVRRPRPLVTCFSPIWRRPAEFVEEAMVLKVPRREQAPGRLTYISFGILCGARSDEDVHCVSARVNLLIYDSIS